MLLFAVEAIRLASGIGPIIIVVGRQHLARARRLIRGLDLKDGCKVVPGGRRRQDSVYRGLQAFDYPPEVVLVHDAARPLVTTHMINTILRRGLRHKAAIAALPVTDTLKREKKSGFVGSTISRSGLWAAQTPQVFNYDLLVLAHEKARKAGLVATDDAALIERLGINVRILAGSPRNLKVTTRSDLKLAELYLKTRELD